MAGNMLGEPDPEKWKCTSCTFQNLKIMSYCEMCGYKPNIKSSQHKPNPNAKPKPATESQPEGPNALVRYNNVNSLFTIHHKGKLMMALPSMWYYWIMIFFFGNAIRVLLNIILFVWITYFPQITLVYAMYWLSHFIPPMIGILFLMWLNKKWNKYNDPISIRQLPFWAIIAFIALAFYALTIDWKAEANKTKIGDIEDELATHRAWLNSLQHVQDNLKTAVDNLYYSVDKLKKTVSKLDKRITKSVEDLDGKYKEMLKEKASVQKVEYTLSKMWEGFGLISVTRAHFGLGCFVNGTLIQVDYLGNVKKIEELNESDTIYNPDLNMTLKMKVFTMGPEEDGYIYQFITNDSFQVSVTKTHPMKICNVGDDKLEIECENIAASDVYEGNVTQTINGYQEIVDIIKIPADNVTVYNLMLDMDVDVAIISRTIIANKIHTFDLYAQFMNEDSVNYFNSIQPRFQ